MLKSEAHYQQAVTAAWSHDPECLKSVRQQAWQRFIELGLPTHHTEAWKYLKLHALREQSFDLLTASPSQTPAIEAYLLTDCYHIVLINGFWHKECGVLPPQVHSQTWRQALMTDPDKMGGYLSPTDDSLLALNTALVQDGLVLTVPEGCHFDKPLQLLLVSDDSSAGKTSQQRHVVNIAADSRITVLEHHISLTNQPVFTNAVWHVNIAEHAEVKWQQWFEFQPEQVHFGYYFVDQQAHSHLEALSFMVEGKILRNDWQQRFLGEYARFRAQSLLATRADQQMDHHVRSEHRVGHCHSEQIFQGLAKDRSRLVVNGKVVVDPQAQKSEANQQQHHLLLSRTAEIYTKPELEIYANDVKCAHGATVGQLSEEALFYLKARGLPEDQARQALITAFVHALVTNLVHPHWQASIEAALAMAAF